MNGHFGFPIILFIVHIYGTISTACMVSLEIALVLDKMITREANRGDRGQANLRLDQKWIPSGVATTADATPHWTIDTTVNAIANTCAKILDSCFRCYIRFAICAGRAHRVNSGHFIKGKQQKVSGYSIRGNYERE